MILHCKLLNNSNYSTIRSIPNWRQQLGARLITSTASSLAILCVLALASWHRSTETDRRCCGGSNMIKHDGNMQQDIEDYWRYIYIYICVLHGWPTWQEHGTWKAHERHWTDQSRYTVRKWDIGEVPAINIVICCSRLNSPPTALTFVNTSMKPAPLPLVFRKGASP